MGLGMGMGDLGEPLFGLVSVTRLRWVWVEEVVWEVRKPSLSFLLANAVNPVKTFPVVHNKPTWCYPLNAQSERADIDIQPTYPIDDVNKMRNLHVLFQDVVLKNRNRPKTRQTGGAGGADIWSLWTLSSVPDCLASFSDHAAVLWFVFVSIAYINACPLLFISSNPLCFQSCFFISCNACISTGHYGKKQGFFIR